jgi:hypothetical protein
LYISCFCGKNAVNYLCGFLYFKKPELLNQFP